MKAFEIDYDWIIYFGYNQASWLKGSMFLKIIAISVIILGILLLVFPDLARWLLGIGLIILGIFALIRK
jgi:hypothetical protein